eukprot:scaffold4384_cov100-Skeletonema_dohrnii-CCMP3373.AAC.1
MHLDGHQLFTILECRSQNNFDGSIDDDMSDILRHNLLSAQVNKNIIAILSHDRRGERNEGGSLIRGHGGKPQRESGSDGR